MSLSQSIDDTLDGLDQFMEEVLLIEARTSAAIIAGEVDRMRAAGVSDTEIRRVLNADFAAKGPIFGRIDNSVRGQVTGSIIAASTGAQEDVYQDAGVSEMRRWVVVNLGPNPQAKVCPDCPTRQDMVLSVEEWQARGEPGTGWSVCGPYCYCLLVPEEVTMQGRIDILT